MNIARRGSCLLLGSLTLLAACDRAPEPGFDVSVPWALTGTTLTLDTHTHTRFSDGELTPDELARLAVDHGCDALAITDHSDHAVAAATPAYFDAVDEVRRQHPGLTVFAGLEWNVPPYDGREHVTVLVEPALERSVLPAFKELHDGMEDQADATKALQWLAGQASSARGEVVLFYNHPSRKDEDAGENERDLAQWRQVNDLFAGFEGGPGHQRSVTPGAYRQTIKPVDRWDPVVAEPGGGWDRLLDAGHDVWGALASSDYHERRNDYAPCRFARTTVTVDKDDARGILRALRAGSFWAGHGGVLSELWFILVEPALPLPATPGETVRLPAAAARETGARAAAPGAAAHRGDHRQWPARPARTRRERQRGAGRGQLRFPAVPAGSRRRRSQRLLPRAGHRRRPGTRQARRLHQPHPRRADALNAARCWRFLPPRTQREQVGSENRCQISNLTPIFRPAERHCRSGSARQRARSRSIPLRVPGVLGR